MPGIGPVPGAEFPAATGGDMSFFGTPDRLAGLAGLVPVAGRGEGGNLSSGQQLAAVPGVFGLRQGPAGGRCHAVEEAKQLHRRA
jgi:Transposase IS116/IS110/IS902 family